MVPEAAARIDAALIGKFGVMKPVPNDANYIAESALTYAHALIGKARA